MKTFVKDHVVTVNYGTSAAVYLFQNMTKRDVYKTMVSKDLLGEAVQSITFDVPRGETGNLIASYSIGAQE